MKGNIGEIFIKRIEELNKLARYIEETLDYHNIPNEYFGNIMLAISESAELILKRKTGKGPLGISVRRDKKGLTFEFRKQDPEETERLDDLDLAIETQQFFRETFIIRTLADATDITDNGKTLRLHFEISGINYERSLLRSERLRKYLTEKEKVRDTK